MLKYQDHLNSDFTVLLQLPMTSISFIFSTVQQSGGGAKAKEEKLQVQVSCYL